jgi:hypothetical protein
MQFCDRSIVVEGALKPYVDMGLPLRSDDGTIEMLTALNKKYDNLTVCHTEVPNTHHPVQYQQAMDIARLEDTDWILIIDYDEIYPTETQKVLRRMLESVSDDIFGVRIYAYNFINTPYHYYDAVFKRAFRCTPQAHFVTDSMNNDNEVRWPDFQKFEDRMQNPQPSHIAILPKQYRFFHYAYIKSQEHIRRKLKMIYDKGNKNIYNMGYSVNERGVFTLPQDILIKQFTKQHPPIMRNHDIFKRT